MAMEIIEQDFRRAVCEQIDLLSEGNQRFRVFTPFEFEDGDRLSIVLKQDPASRNWMLSDEGHTLLHLTYYDISSKDLRAGTRQKIIASALTAFQVEDRDGELVASVRENHYGDALYSFVQALLKITDLSFLSRERVHSTFVDDFRATIDELVPEARRQWDWSDPTNDREGLYPIDVRVNHAAEPLLIFGLNSDSKVRDATVSLLKLRGWNLAFQSLGIFEDQEVIARDVLARFTDAVDKEFSSLTGNKPEIDRYLRRWLARNPTDSRS